MVQQEAFIRSFVRPCGLDVPATGVMADALESLAAAGRPSRRRPRRAIGRIGLRDAARARARAGRTPAASDEREVTSKKRRADEEQARGAAGIAG